MSARATASPPGSSISCDSTGHLLGQYAGLVYLGLLLVSGARELEVRVTLAEEPAYATSVLDIDRLNRAWASTERRIKRAKLSTGHCHSSRVGQYWTSHSARGGR
eukprot:2558650-Rhodomonas_salina.4